MFFEKVFTDGNDCIKCGLLSYLIAWKMILQKTLTDS